MMVKGLYSNQEAGNEESTLLQDPYDDQEEEEEEALSLCDLPIYSDSAISAQLGDEFSKLEDGKNSRSSDNKDDEDDDNLFEFFSEEFTTASSTRATSENIIFCGKLIPFKDHPRVPQKNPKSNSTKRGNNQKKGLNMKSFACDYTSMGKVSLVRSATKSRWFLFMFGMSKLSSNEMQLSDIRNRQSRREPATMFPAPENGKEVVKTEGRMKKNCKGMWKMFRSISLVLGCSSSKLANDVVKAAFV